MIKEIEEILKIVSAWSISVQTIFFLDDVPDWSEELTSATCFKPLQSNVQVNHI